MLSRQNLKGFTLIEAMVVVAMVAILAVLAMPSFIGMIANQRVKSTAQELQTLFQFARAEAVYKRKQVTVVPNSSQRWQAKDSAAVLRGGRPVRRCQRRTGFHRWRLVLGRRSGQARVRQCPYKISVSATNASRVQCLSVVGTGLVRLENVAAGQNCP